MADMFRSTPEPPLGAPRVQHQPGMADQMLRELAPLLAEDGIDLDDPDGVPDMATLQAALQRATQRQNMMLFPPGRCGPRARGRPPTPGGRPNRCRRHGRSRRHPRRGAA